MDWLISALLFIVALGLLICLHELGHFSMAKLFNVYCHEFSLGFGPALLKKRKEGHETYFSIRAFPIGGYVSMYGEEDEEIEPGLKLPPERSIEGVKKWKKAIIISAGIIVNAIFAIVLFGVENLCFPSVAATDILSVKEESIAYVSGFRENDNVIYLSETDNVQYYFEYQDSEGILNAGYFLILDNDVVINETHYVATFDFYTGKNDNKLNEGIILYEGATKEEVNNDDLLSKLFSGWISKEGSPDYYPNVKKPFNYSTIEEEINFNLTLTIIRDEESVNIDVPINISKEGFQDIGLSLKVIKYYPKFKERFKGIWVDFGDASIAVFKGLKILFSKGGIKNMSGLVGIFTTSKQLYSTQTFATYLRFWGLISVNLAIFNLLPFPGLDGWQLLVIAIEGITKKKVPTKVKSIMNLVGMILLFALMAVILVVDIVRLI